MPQKNIANFAKAHATIKATNEPQNIIAIMKAFQFIFRLLRISYAHFK
jgi:hypothetical protein